jgi:hypothetical protein
MPEAAVSAATRGGGAAEAERVGAGAGDQPTETVAGVAPEAVDANDRGSKSRSHASRTICFSRAATGPTSTPRRYFGQNTTWYFAENNGLFADRDRTPQSSRPGQTQPTGAATPRGRLAHG